MTPNAPPDEAVRRFADDLAWCGVASTDRLGLCISGGPDSLALLLLARTAGVDCLAATVDHGLRADAKEEALYVSSLCKNIHIAHEILPIPAEPYGNIQDWARQGRYDQLRQWAKRRQIDLLLTAHHADDQLETMIMRLNRGAGLAGLSSIRRRQKDIARPLLRWRKSELVALVHASGLVAVDDPSNRNLRFDRARIRQHLAKAEWLDPIAAVNSAEALSQANDALDWMADSLFYDRATKTDQQIVLTISTGIPHELVRRLVVRALATCNPGATPRGEALERTIASLRGGLTVTLCGVKCEGGHEWRFSREAPRRTK